MKKNEAFKTLKNSGIEQADMKKYLIKIELSEPFDQSNKRKPWTDDELRVVFSFTETKQNCLLLAKAFKRGYGGIRQIFSWAKVSEKKINESKFKGNKFVQQIKQISNEMKWLG